MARIHVIVADEIVADIDDCVGARGRSNFLEKAARAELERLHQKEALTESAEILRAEDYPEWATTEKAAAWVREQRRSWGDDPVAVMARGNALRMLGDLQARFGDLDAAERHFESALTLGRGVRDRLGEMSALQALGDLYTARCNWEAAIRHLEEALEVAHVAKDRLGEANALQALSEARAKMGDTAGAQRDHDAARRASQSALYDIK